MSYADAATIAASAAWQNRVNLVALHAAVQVASEPQNTQDRSVRAHLARQYLAGSHDATLMPRLVMTNPTVRTGAVADKANNGAAVPDTDLEFAVSSLWTACAKALYGER